MKLIDTIQDIITEQRGNKPLAQTIVNRRLKKAKELAVDFPNPRQFALKYKKLWHFIRHYNLIDELFPDRKKYREDYTPEEVKKLANGFAVALDFEIEHPTAYNYAVRHKMIPDLFPDRRDKMKSYATYFGNKEASPYYNKEIQKHFDHLMDRASSQYKDMGDLKKRNPELYKQLEDLGHDYVPEDMTEQSSNKRYGAVLIGGLTHGESLDEQISRLSSSMGVTVKGFSHSSPVDLIKEFLQQNRNIPLFLFSAGCRISGQLSGLPYVNKNRFYIIEPTFSGGETTTSVRKAVSDGVPASNVFVGPSSGRGMGIVRGTSDSRASCHYCSISSVGSMF